MECLYTRLPQQLCDALRALDPKCALHLEEIRVYGSGRAVLVIAGSAQLLPIRISMEELLCALSGHALYSCEEQMAQGYIPLPGGHRAGVCGRMTCQQDGTYRMADVSSVCIRVCRRIPNASAQVRPYLLDGEGCARRVLLLGAPGCGKTTVLRDAALWLAEEGLCVAVADEREELFAHVAMELPPGIDVLGGLDKQKAFSMLLRSMAPKIIISDEIGHERDMQAVLDAVRCGTGLLISAHARSLEDAFRRPVIRQMLHEDAFDCCILLGCYGSVCGVFDHQASAGDGKVRRAAIGADSL